MARLTQAEHQRLQSLAKDLYLMHPTLTYKELGEKVGVGEKSISIWVQNGNWQKLRKSLLTTKQNQISQFYDQLERLNFNIKNREIIRDIPASHLKPCKIIDLEGNEIYSTPMIDESKYPILQDNTPNTKEANIIMNLTTAIKRLETEVSIGEIIEIGIGFMNFVKTENSEFAKTFSQYYDAFIQSKAKEH